MKKIHLFVVTFASVLFVTVLCLLFLNLKPNPVTPVTSTPTETPVPTISTSGWKNLQDKLFSLKYPNNWKVLSQKSATSIFEPERCLTLVVTTKQSSTTDIKSFIKNAYFKDQNYPEVLDYIETNYQQASDYDSLFTPEFDMCGTEHQFYIKDKTVVDFEISHPCFEGSDGSSDLEKHCSSVHDLDDQIMPKILESFKFVTSTSLKSQIENWGNYTEINQKHDFQVGDACEGYGQLETDLTTKIISGPVKSAKISQVTFYYTPNYLNLTNQQFKNIKLGCNMGGPFPLEATPDKLVWYTGGCGGIAPSTDQEKSDMALCEKTNQEIKNLF